MSDKLKDAQNTNNCKVKKSCSDEIMKPRKGVMNYGDDMQKPMPMPYERIHKTTRFLS